MKVRKIDIIIFVTMLALFEPSYFTSLGAVHTLFKALKFVAFFYAIYALLRAKLYEDRFIVASVGMLIWIGISTVIYGTSISGYFHTFRSLFAIIIIVSYGLKYSPANTVKTITIILSAWILADGLTYSKTGLYSTSNGQIGFFLGTGTTFTYYLFVAIAFSLVLFCLGKKKTAIISFLMIIVGSVTYLTQVNVSTALVCLACMGVMLFLHVRKSKIIKPILTYGYFGTTVLNFLIVSGIIQNAFSYLLENILGEGLDYNGRTQIWQMVLYRIIKRPVIGYGYDSGITFDVWQAYNTSPHNFYLYIAFVGGIVCLALFLILQYMIQKPLVKTMNYSSISSLLLIILLVINIEAITESCCFNEMYFALMVLAWKSPQLLKTEY